MRERERNLVNSRADELATKDNVVKQDGEIAARLGMLGLFIEHEASDGHQISALSIGTVIHFLGMQEKGEEGKMKAKNDETLKGSVKMWVFEWRKKKKKKGMGLSAGNGSFGRHVASVGGRSELVVVAADNDFRRHVDWVLR